MKRSLFTDEELKAMWLADEEIEKSFPLTPEDWERSKAMDKQARADRLDNKGRRIAAQKAAYYEANREKWNAYLREYRRRKKLLALQEEKAASRSSSPESSTQECSHAPNISKI